MCNEQKIGMNFQMVGGEILPVLPLVICPIHIFLVFYTVNQKIGKQNGVKRRLMKEVSIQANGASIANGSTVVDISIKPPSFKRVSLSSPRYPLSKTPKQVIFLTLSTFCHFYHTITLLTIYFFTFFV